MNAEELAETLAVPNLPQLLLEVENRLRNILDSADPMLGRPARRLLDNGGKRLRPVLVIASANARGAHSSDKIISGAVAVELIHLGSLIHDDIIDKDELRRGVPTISAKEGLNTALLVGDWLFSRGLAESAKINRQAAEQAALAICEMCEGQALELSKGYKIDPRDSAYLGAAQKKSGSLIVAACRIGGLCAGLPEADIKALSGYARAFGIAFQIIDDISDGDFSQTSLDQAAKQAKHYKDQAAKALKDFEAGSSAAGLVKLADTYVNSSLINKGLLKPQKA